MEILKDVLMKKIHYREAKIAVVGLGYVGLPLAIETANQGFKVYGIDICKDKIESLSLGKSYILDINDEDIKSHINKNLFVGCDFSIVSEVDAIIICVPTPLNEMKEPDVSYIKSVVKDITKYLKAGVLISLESTTYPGSTEELVVKVIEKSRKIEVGKDFFVCHSPERVDPSNSTYHVKNTSKIIGGCTSNCLELGTALYEKIIEKVIPVSSIRVAEMAKLLENTFRSVNVALINELTMMSEFMDINIWEVIEAAGTKPFGFMPFYPGIGVGGHCLPVDPVYLSWKAKKYNYYNRFIELTTEINENMPRYVTNQIADILNNIEKSIKNSSILMVGLTYKKDTNDLRESPALKLFKLLKKKGAKIEYHDGYVPSLKYDQEIFYSQELTVANIQRADITIIATDHSYIDYQFIINNSKIVYDTKNATKGYKGRNIVLLGGYTMIE
ncbi:nucleotide sugar dehydrogenase [Wukongibacter sp. M2B1]|uniref:nucleotide sugar dehydrogenase n=1 Tax=Wukongibacter sp. M2B1 TaxID=3088895 RepID=UPI003D7B0AF6